MDINPLKYLGELLFFGSVNPHPELSTSLFFMLTQLVFFLNSTQFANQHTINIGHHCLYVKHQINFFSRRLVRFAAAVQLGQKRTIVRSVFCWKCGGCQTGDEAERQQRAAHCEVPRYRTIVKSEARQTKFPSFPAGSGTNNSSLSHPAASGTEQLFVLPAGISSRANKWCEQRAWQKPVRAAPTPNKSESPSPKARLVKPDDLRDTEHTKRKRYFWACMLSCSISIGSLWVFVASFMRFWASV